MNYFFIAIAVIFIIYIFIVIRKKEFSVEESIFWVFGAIVSLILAIFPKLIDKISVMLNIAYPPSLLFLLAIVFLLFINFRNTKKMEKQNEKIIELAQRLSIMEYEVDKLKKEETSDKK
ncbi:MAG: DUF2304 domain-containing protein [Clostridia bacterium]|nr:DUF2304 domain-containing protein [Clostridia bacterium]